MQRVLFFRIAMIIPLFYSCAYAMTKWETGKKQRNTMNEPELVSRIPKRIFTTNSTLTVCRFFKADYKSFGLYAKKFA